MTSIVDDCAHQCLLPDGQATICDSLPPFDEELVGDVTVEELSLPAPSETLDDNQVTSGSSLPATPAERPCTFCPSSLPLPPASCPARATLVLDLDGTLIASEELNAANSAYLWNTPAGARAPDYEAMGRRVWLRPGVREFLSGVRPHFEVVLFTAATQNWAAAAIEQLDPAAELFDVMLHRDHTTSDLMWDYVKDLSRLGRDLARVVIVDDNPLMFMYQPDNALHIGAYEASIAGGPDNVLPRVSEVLINQVAHANDVREILGPMAAAKCCITSTVSTADAATQADVQQHGSAAAGVMTGTSAEQAERDYGSSSGDHSMVDAADHEVSCCAAEVHDGERVQGDAAMDGNWVVGGYAGTQVPHDGQGTQEQAQQRQPEDSQWSNGLSNGCESEGSLADNAEKDLEWEGDDEGAETFDEHGAAAQLGADVVGNSHRHRTWDEPRCSRKASEAAATETAGVSAAVVQESGEQDSDACPEEHSANSSEDFEALMDDAMAEYDSDAYESPYCAGTEYDYSCSAGKPASGAILPRSPIRAADHAAGNGNAGTDGICQAFPSSCSHRPCAFQVPCALGSEAATDLVVYSRIEAAAEQPVAYARVDSIDASFDGSNSIVSVPIETACIAAGAAAAETSTNSGRPSLMVCADAAGLSNQHPCHILEDAQAQPRQPPLPTGMVFLTDLNPAFGAGCATPDAAPASPGGYEAIALSASAAPAGGDISRKMGSLGCKRMRAETEGSSDVSDGAREVAAKLWCHSTPHSTRMHLSRCDAHAGDTLAASVAVGSCSVLPAAEAVVLAGASS
ncbi:hypothetical protein VOLCADRAFT_118933 [Volvox carteri f. nagariensis]|uniref:FCP1 homology domain-containing protein n=1 Tax=Volvox carteri f. nagariensis TaxID=3068 RepID=D8U8S8_VOLCA|nr:uncharacterized protein VOLCADRAFT_118933 [Volvox carteri f. nagariensis]EFJ43801.1 hypothetical protein VOLCADRAFT_118933 [Volvox carteri f. nagariensis]|eukprot:XP_002955047.1 hypothetical protein VOLCADRAFT_118933 [Volvox carteri f. nagariensis]